jgi:microcystin-dependent protein
MAFFGSLLTEAGVSSPSGTVDVVGNSEYLQSLRKIATAMKANVATAIGMTTNSLPSGSIVVCRFDTGTSGNGGVYYCRANTGGETDNGDDIRLMTDGRILQRIVQLNGQQKLNHGTTLPASPLDYERFFHETIGTEVYYNGTAWTTVSGSLDDLKPVFGATLGTTGDFAAGTYTTVLGKNPGWTVCTEAYDRALVDSGSTYTGGQTFGADEVTLTADQIPEHVHPINHDSSSATSGANLAGSGLASDTTAYSEVNDTDGDPVDVRQKSIAFYILRKTVV